MEIFERCKQDVIFPVKAVYISHLIESFHNLCLWTCVKQVCQPVKVRLTL